MNIKKWKECPGFQETKGRLETHLEDKKTRNIFNWVFQIIVTLVFAIVVGIVRFQSVTIQESSMEPTLTVGEKLFVNRGFIRYLRRSGEISLCLKQTEVMKQLFISAV